MEQIRRIFKKAINLCVPGQLPKFMIIGAQKAGTTSLHYYLSQHKLLLGSRPKEVNFFSHDDNFEKGIGWYRQAFVNIKSPFKKLTSFEATPEYLYRKNVAERLYQFNPDLKLIILLRDPVKRAFSAWNMYKYFGERKKGLPAQFYSNYCKDRDNNIYKELYGGESFPTFEKAINSELKKLHSESELEEPSFLRRGIYLPQVEKYVNLFGRDNVLVVGFKDLVGKDKSVVLNEICTFVGVPSQDWSQIKDDKTNSRSYQEPLTEKMMGKLQNFYQPYNEALFTFLDKKINW